MEKIRLLCLRFRKAILMCPKNLLPSSFALFPAGACGDSSLVLAIYLQDNGYGVFDYVFGWKGTQSHAWLEKNGLIVDITIDQFDEQLPDVFVSRSFDSHRQFTDIQRNRAELSLYDPYSRGELQYAYNRIIHYVNLQDELIEIGKVITKPIQ